MKKDALIIVRGGGDLATGTIHRLWSAGLRVLVLETTQPAAIRRQVALCEAVYEGETIVEGLHAVRIETLEQAQSVWAQSAVPVLIDPEGACIARAKPEVVVDAILAKRNLGTHRDMAPLTIALGPGFVAGQDVDAVVETKRGHRLGRIIREGSAIPNTGIPGVIGGYGAERVIHAQAGGVFMNVRKIGDLVEAKGIEGAGNHVRKGGNNDAAEQPAEQQEQLAAGLADVLFDQHTHALAVVLNGSIQGTKVGDSAEEDAAQQHPQQHRQPAESCGLNGTGNRACTSNGAELVGKHRPAVGRHIVPAILVDDSRGLGSGVNAPFVGQPAAVKHISAKQAHRCDQYDDQRIHSFLPLSFFHSATGSER